MKLYTNKEYVFIKEQTWKLYIQSSRILILKKKAPLGKVWTDIQNYIESENGKKKVSVNHFNKVGLKFIGEL